ncbi:MAG: molybdopterin-binding protein [Thermodesulfovibrionales bacterium]
MCEISNEERKGFKTIPLTEAVGTVLAHDITEIRQGEFKGRAFRKGHIIRQEDIEHLRRLGKENLYVLKIGTDEMHEDEAAVAIARALMGEGVEMEGEPKEGKINIIASRDGLLKINKEALFSFNMLGDVMCATLHNNTVVKKGQIVGGTRAIPLVVKREIIERAVEIATEVSSQQSAVSSKGIIEVKELRRPRAGIVITGNEVYYGRIKDAFAPIITKKIEAYHGEIVGIYYAPDDVEFIEARLRELLAAGADLLITTGGMSVDPDDVTRFAIRKLGAVDITYGSAVLPGAMFLVAYIRPADQQTSNEISTSPIHPFNSSIPVIGIPACGMYHKTTVFDLILPRVLAGEKIGRRELAELGHGGLCLNCKECRYPVCPFGKI